MRQIADSVFALGSRGHNYYLLRDGDEVTMVDAGCSREWGRLLGALDELGLSVDAVSGVVATHSHSDHFGLARRAADEGIDVHVHEDEESRALGTYSGRYAASPSEIPMFRIHTLRNFLPLVFAGVMSLDHLETVRTFRDGETLDLPGTPTAIHTPGHTEGHTMFHVPHLGILFTGDGLVTMDLLGSDSGPQMMPETFDLDHTQAIASLDRIEALDASMLLPGHGQPWRASPAEAVGAARSSEND
jgi:glyoxylase-like metal-dependent hydrolase (beta-lactamase superfamily II)